MQKKFARKYFILFFGVIYLFGFSHVNAQNSSLYFKEPTDLIGVGDEFSVPLYLNSAGKVVNTIAGDVIFTDSSIKLERVETANSIITSWIEIPKISGNSVTFSGIMPGGYESVIDPNTDSRLPGQVFNLIFVAKSEGSATLSFSESHLYLNDSLGTETGVSSLPFTITILPKGTNKKINLNDTTPPESFVPIVSSSPDIYDGAYTLFFSTTDKGSGIDHYEVSEGGGDWVIADSPYRLNDQSLKGKIRVKAIDLAGNYTIGVTNGLSVSSPSLALIPVLLFLIVLVILYVVYHHKMKRFHKKHAKKHNI